MSTARTVLAMVIIAMYGFGIAKVFKLARRVRDETGPKKIDTKQCRRRKLQTISSRIVCSFSPDTRENSSLTGNEVKDRV
jgi:hypothetical protein